MRIIGAVFVNLANAAAAKKFQAWNHFLEQAFYTRQRKEIVMSKLNGRDTGSPASDLAGSNARPTSSQVTNLLKAMYGTVESEGIPERFLELLEKLDEAERNRSVPVQN